MPRTLEMTHVQSIVIVVRILGIRVYIYIYIPREVKYIKFQVTLRI